MKNKWSVLFLIAAFTACPVAFSDEPTEQPAGAAESANKPNYMGKKAAHHKAKKKHAARRAKPAPAHH